MTRLAFILAASFSAVVLGLGIGVGIGRLLAWASITIPPQTALVILGGVAFAGLLTFLIADDAHLDEIETDDREDHQ